MRIRYLNNGWLTQAYLIHHGVVPYMCGTVMARNPFLVEMETLLRVNMLFNWITGVYGPLDDFKISLADVTTAWVDILGKGFTPYGAMFPSRLSFYTRKELEFWNEVKTGDYRVFPSPNKKPKGKANLYILK